MRVGGHLARIVAGGEEGAGEAVERDRLRPGDLDGAVDRPGERQFGEHGSDVVGRDRLQQGRRQADDVAVGCRLDDAVGEFEELRRAQDRVGNAGRLDEVFLRHLGAQVAAVGQPVGTDDRQGEMVPHAGHLFGGKQVAAGGLEELHHGLVGEVGRVGDVDDDIGADKCLGEAFAGDGVDARIGRRREHRMAGFAQPVDDIRSDEASASDDDELHFSLHLAATAVSRSVWREWQPGGAKTLWRSWISAQPCLKIRPSDMASCRLLEATVRWR